MTGECKTKNVDTELGERIAAPDVRPERARADGAVEAFDRRPAVRDATIGQAGAMKGEIAERDGAAVSGRQPDWRREESLGEIVEGDLAFDNQIGEESGGEHGARFTELKPGRRSDRRPARGPDARRRRLDCAAFPPGGRNAPKRAVIDPRDQGRADCRGIKGRRGLCGKNAGIQNEQDGRRRGEAWGVVEYAHAFPVIDKWSVWVRVTTDGSVPAAEAQRGGTRSVAGRPAARSSISGLMRRFSRILGLLSCAAAPLSAQVRWQDTLPPRGYVKLAMRARVKDSVAVRAAEWRQWAAAEPQAVAPRFALGLLSRYNQRFSESLAWLDSAAIYATSPLWRNAVARERVTSLVIQGEFTAIPSLMETVMQDSAGIPLAEWAEARYLRMGLSRRRGNKITLADLDSIDAMSSPADSLLRARVGCLRAAVDTARRLEHATAAIALAEAASARFISGNCELVVGQLFANAGQMAPARVWFNRAEATSRAAHDAPTLAATLQLHGYMLSTYGYIPWARAKLAESIRIAERIDDRNIQAWALLGVANSANQIGDAGAASVALRRAASLFDATGDALGSWNARLEHAAEMVQLGDLVGAERLARGAKAAGDSLRYPSLRFRALNTVSDIAVRSRRFDEAVRLLDSADVISTEELDRGFATQLQSYRGVLSLNRGARPEAITLLTASLASYAKAQNLYRHFVEGPLSLAWLRSGDSAKAARYLIDANDDFDLVRDTIAGTGLRRVVMLPDTWGGSQASGDHVLAGFMTSSRWLPTAFAVTERSRSRALQKGSFGMPGADTTQAFVEARKRVRATATSLRDVQRTLAPTTALLVYAGGASTARTSLMIITRNSARGITLAPLDSLDRDIVRWLALMESGESGAGAGRQVATAVLSNALRGLPSNIRRLVIVPQGPLYRVPFQALPFARGVLGDRAVVTISPSVSLALSYAAEPRSVSPSVLALGAGDTEIQSAMPQQLEINIERSERGNPLAPLMAAGDEARAAASWGTGSMALTGSNATEAALKRAARGTFTVLHAAAHALTSDQALGANYLILRADSTDDGYVSGGELGELSVGRSMVVLSGCRTTGDFGSRGDAIDGLVAPLLARGVRTVVASHWAVSDRWTKVLMERFYQSLAAGATTADAMNSAQTSLRRAGVPARFWAAFSVIGDGALTFAPAVTVRSSQR